MDGASRPLASTKRVCAWVTQALYGNVIGTLQERQTLESGALSVQDLLSQPLSMALPLPDLLPKYFVVISRHYRILNGHVT